MWKGGLFSNKLLIGAVLLTVVLQVAVVYLPFLQPIFETEPMTLPQVAVSLLACVAMFIFVRLESK
jgi:Ca2+-transporting ATPase